MCTYFIAKRYSNIEVFKLITVFISTFNPCLYVFVHLKYFLIAELGTFSACFKSFILMLKYYNRLKRIEFDNESRNSLLRSAFIEDKKLNK